MKPLAPKTCALPKNLPSLTSCRFFAALAVVLHHSGATGSAYEAVGKAGWMGVSFFFALSGFVLMWSFDPSRSKMDFYINRLSRIYPLHLFGLLVSLAAFFALGSPLAGYVGTELGTLASLVLVHDWIPGHREIRQAWGRGLLVAELRVLLLSCRSVPVRAMVVRRSTQTPRQTRRSVVASHCNRLDRGTNEFGRRPRFYTNASCSSPDRVRHGCGSSANYS